LEEQMAVAEALIPGSEVRVPDHPGAPIELRGEFDLFELRSLVAALEVPAGSTDPVRIDLSGITFLDARCARELVVRSFPRGDRLTLDNASREAERSLRACAKGLPGGRVSSTGKTENGG
jgi:hypothetical protein